MNFVSLAGRVRHSWFFQSLPAEGDRKLAKTDYKKTDNFVHRKLLIVFCFLINSSIYIGAVNSLINT